MTNAPAQSLLTADELLALPENGCQYELVQGRLVAMSPSSSKPAIVGGNVHAEINVFVKQHRLGICGGADWGFRLFTDPDTVRAPDCAFVRGERVPTTGVPDGFWPGAPDLAVEVLSPSNRPGEMFAKVEDYLNAGTRLVWLIDPEAREAHVFRPDRSPTRVGEHGALSGEDVLPGFTLNLAEIWM